MCPIMQPGPGLNISDSRWEDTFHSHDVWNVQRNVQLITNVEAQGCETDGWDQCREWRVWWLILRPENGIFPPVEGQQSEGWKCNTPLLCDITPSPPPSSGKREEEEVPPTGVSSPDYKNKIFRDPAQINIFSHSFVILSPMTKWQIPELSPEHFVTLREEDTSRNNLICYKYENIFTIYMFLLFSPYHDCGTTDVRLYLVMSQCLSRLKIYENIVELLLLLHQQRNIYLGSFLPLTFRSSSFGYLVNWGGMG